MASRPLIAANWKMNKTIAEARGVLRAAPARRRGARRRRRRGRHLPALPRAAAGRAALRRAPASASPPRTCTSRTRAPSPARSRRRCCSTPASTASSSATPSAASSSARPTRRSPARCRRRSTAGLLPILCVGESEAERERDETEAVLRRQVDADLAEVADDGARRGRDRLRADLGDRHRQDRHRRAGPGRLRLHPLADRRPRRRGGRAGPDPVRRLGQARPTPPSCSASPTSTAPWSAAPRSTPRTSPRSSRRPEADDGRFRADPTRCRSPGLALVILDGWGLAEPGPGNAISLAETPIFDALWERVPAHAALGLGPRRRPARRADGQLRGRPPQPRRRGDRQAGPRPDRRRRRRRQLLRERGPRRRLRARPQQPPRPPAPDRPRLRRRRPLRLGAHRGLHRAGRPRGRPRPRPPRLHRRPRHAARTAAPATSRRSSAGCAAPAGSAPSAAATTRWTATTAGSGRSSPTTRSSTAPGRAPRRAGEAIADAYAAGDTDEFIKPTVIGDYDGMQPGDVVISFNFRPDRMRQIVAALGDPGFDEFDRGGDPGLDLTTMTELPRRLALPGRLPAAPPRRRRWPR